MCKKNILKIPNPAVATWKNNQFFPTHRTVLAAHIDVQYWYIK